MGLDGFSMGNLGLATDLTSAQMANQAEQLARKESEFKIKDVSELLKDDAVRRKDEHSQKDNQFDDGFKKKKKDDESEEEDEELKTGQLEDVLLSVEGKNPEEFSVRINPVTEMVELFNNKEKRVLETIDAKDLMTIVSKLNSASGILVNRKI